MITNRTVLTDALVPHIIRPESPQGGTQGGARSRGSSRPISGEDTEMALTANAIGCEIRMIDRKNYGDGFAVRQVHQRGISEVHGPIPIARHQGSESTAIPCFRLC